MNRSDFAVRLRDAVSASLQEFCEDNPQESPYALAIIEGQCGNYLGFAIATEEGLLRVARRYDSWGYRYNGWDWEKFDNVEKLAVWLRWANPDDGWHYGDFPERFEIGAQLASLVESGAFGESAGDLGEFCNDVLSSLQSDETWQSVLRGRTVFVGVTYGESTRDFLRTATRANPYKAVGQLWAEHCQRDEINRRILRPRSKED